MSAECTPIPLASLVVMWWTWP